MCTFKKIRCGNIAAPASSSVGPHGGVRVGGKDEAQAPGGRALGPSWGSSVQSALRHPVQQFIVVVPDIATDSDAGWTLPGASPVQQRSTGDPEEHRHVIDVNAAIGL